MGKRGIRLGLRGSLFLVSLIAALGIPLGSRVHAAAKTGRRSYAARVPLLPLSHGPAPIDILLTRRAGSPLVCEPFRGVDPKTVRAALSEGTEMTFVHIGLKEWRTGWVTYTERHHPEPRVLDPLTSSPRAQGLTPDETRSILAFLAEPGPLCRDAATRRRVERILHSSGKGGRRDPILVGWALTAAWAAASLSLPFFCAGPIARSRMKRRERLGRCTACGYSLTGLTTAVCPECGGTHPPAGGTLVR